MWFLALFCFVLVPFLNYRLNPKQSKSRACLDFLESTSGEEDMLVSRSAAASTNQDKTKKLATFEATSNAHTKIQLLSTCFNWKAAVIGGRERSLLDLTEFELYFTLWIHLCCSKYCLNCTGYIFNVLREKRFRYILRNICWFGHILNLIFSF